jgi:hypothetical protein
VLGVAEMGHDLDGCMHEDAADCPCPSFRTQAQQEARERAERALEAANSQNEHGDALIRLLELYP